MAGLVGTGDSLRRIQAGVAAWLTRPPLGSCLISDSACIGPAIQAHSVQRAILSSISQSGHVYMFQHRIGSKFRFERVGVRDATTFTGFCAYHDCEIFRDVDFSSTQTFDPCDKRQMVLLGFRALACEYWKKLNSRLFYRTLFECQRGNDLAGLIKLLGHDPGNAKAILENHAETRQMLKEFDYAVDRMGRWFTSLTTSYSRFRDHLLSRHPQSLPLFLNFAILRSLRAGLDQNRICTT
jgi:hypothetical protein